MSSSPMWMDMFIGGQTVPHMGILLHIIFDGLRMNLMIATPHGMKKLTTISNTKNNIMLNDESPMPFGKHKGKPMSEVPADYLFWYWTNGGEQKKDRDPVARYIDENLDALKQEYPDGEW